jgi:hypothetical protein
MRFNVEYFDKVVLGHSLFKFDPDRSRLSDLQQKGNFLNYDQMQNDGLQLKFIYDERNRCIFKGSLSASDRTADLYRIVLPLGIARLQHDQDLNVYDRINKVSWFHGYGFQMLGASYVDRTLGIKPKIEMLDQTYYLHTNINMLGSTLSSGFLSLSDLSLKEDRGGTWLEGFYSSEQEKFLKFDPNNQAALLGAYLVQLPELPILDGIGVAEKEGKEKYHYLNEYPIRTLFKAPMTQLTRTSSLEITSKLNSIHLDWLIPVKRSKSLKI